MARMIDADELEMFPYSEVAGTEEQIEDWIEQVGLSGDDTASRARNLCWKVIDGCINVVKTQPTLTQPNEPLTVTEVCPHCESEITMEWDVKTRGHKAFCPVCGNRLMLCDECQHGEPGHICDYDSNKDTCRFNRRPPEGEEET